MVAVPKPDDIHDREREWASLSAFASDAAEGPTLGLVYRRRRQGKTLLIESLSAETGGLYPWRWNRMRRWRSGRWGRTSADMPARQERSFSPDGIEPSRRCSIWGREGDRRWSCSTSSPIS